MSSIFVTTGLVFEPFPVLKGIKTSTVNIIVSKDKFDPSLFSKGLRHLARFDDERR